MNVEFKCVIQDGPIQVVARFKAKVCVHSPAQIVGSIPDGYMDVCLF